MTERTSIAPFMLALCLVAAPLTAQLSGNFTIDPNGSGSRNYKSFGAAVLNLWINGINCNCSRKSLGVFP